jgi:hypothetical protein
MKFLMLRGQVPQDRTPQEIVFNTIEEVDDMWTQLFVAMLGDKDMGELWYWGGNREKKFTLIFTERWVPFFATYSSDFIPDVIFCRGGFMEYHTVLNKFPNAIKIYYGAGRRFLPQPGFHDYDIILQDSIEQVEICKKYFPKALVTLFIKPAPDNLFYPMIEVEKEYDICFPANGAQDFKGHSMVYTTVPQQFKLLNLGNNPRDFKYPSNVTSYRTLKAEVPKHIAKCKIGIVAVRAEIDSCPRVIPEMLACGLPIVVLDRVRFWKEKYIVPCVTGELANEDNFWTVVSCVLDNIDKYNPRKYYEEKLSLDIAADFLRSIIDECNI